MRRLPCNRLFVGDRRHPCSPTPVHQQCTQFESPTEIRRRCWAGYLVRVGRFSQPVKGQDWQAEMWLESRAMDSLTGALKASVQKLCNSHIAIHETLPTMDPTMISTTQVDILNWYQRGDFSTGRAPVWSFVVGWYGFMGRTRRTRY